VLECLTPEYIKDSIDRLYSIIMQKCGSVDLCLIEIPFEGKAGGDDIGPAKNADIIIETVPQLSWAWQTVYANFVDPWLKFPQIKKYIKDNDLMKFLIDDDCDTKTVLWAKFESLLKGWAYNYLMNQRSIILKKYGIHDTTHQPTGPATTRQTTKHVKTEPAKTATRIMTRPVHKNKAFLGGIGITVASAIVGFLNAHVSPSLALLVAGIISTVLAAVEHKSVEEIESEIMENV